jgi:hypothetical protein
LWAWLMVRPTTGPLSQISQRFAITFFLECCAWSAVTGRLP